MLIVHQNKTRAYNSDSIETFYITSNIGNTWEIRGVKHEDYFPMASYKTMEEAESEFTRLISAINDNNAKVFYLL